MRGLILALVLQALVLSRQVAAQSCYYDSYGRYHCNYYYLSTAARVGISIGVFFFFFVLIMLCIMRRRRIMAARNVNLLQTQQSQQNAGLGGQWVPPPGGTPYGNSYNNGAYPMQPNNTGYGGPQPFQPGYTGNYAPPPGGADAVKGYDVNNVQEPPRAYDPDQPYHSPTPAPVAPTNNAPNDPPTYSGYSAPSGPPPGMQPQTTGGSNNPYYSPPNTTKT